MHADNNKTAVLEAALLVLLGFLWGIPYALNKISLATIPPMTGVAARVSLAAIALWIVVFMLKCKLPSRRDFIPRVFVQGLIGCLIPYTFIAFAQQSVDSALAAILNSTTPLFVCLISLAWTRHEPLTFGRLFGVSIGLAGVIMIAGASALLGLGQSAFGQGAVILASVASAASVIHGRRFADAAPEITAAGTLTSTAVILVPLCFVVEAPFQSTPSAASIAALLVNAFVATAFGFVVYFRLIRTIGSMGTASVGYLKLAVGVLIGCTLMGESLTWTTATGLLAILLGVVAINQRQSSWAPHGLHPSLRCVPRDPFKKHQRHQNILSAASRNLLCFTLSARQRLREEFAVRPRQERGQSLD
jgi:drug/metabolite transporter (DMT)-like permease